MAHKNKSHGFTLIEIMIVVAIIGVIIAIAVPAYIRSREVSRARSCQENLAKISGAMDQYALEFKLKSGDPITYPDDLVKDSGTGYLKQAPFCQSGGTYATALTIDGEPSCSIAENASAPYAPHLLTVPAS